MSYTLPGTELLTLKQTSESGFSATFEIEPLLPGFGVSIGNTLRRILLSSIEGSAITSARINGASHEFTTIKGVREDLVTLILNLKQLKVKLNGQETTSVVLKKAGPGTVTAADFKANSAVQFTDPKQVIATLEKDGKLELEIEVAKGRGYSSTESRKDEKLPLGTIAIDSIFSPVTRVSYDIDNTRVGNLTNYDKITMSITTDGSVSPREALETAACIAVEHFSILAGNPVVQSINEAEAIETSVSEDVSEEKPKRSRSKKTTEEAS